jgi:PD-(D/E)XK nuclease superfamily
MASGTSDLARLLAAQGVKIAPQQREEEHRRRGVTDLITLMLCARHAHYFSQQRYPSQTPATVLGHILHRTIKHLYDRYQAEHASGQSIWLPGELDVREECQVAEEAARAQGLPRLSQAQSERLRAMLSAFHALEAPTFYPQVREAEVNLQWLWEEAPGGPLLLEGKVDVVVTGERAGGTGIVLWDYKTTQQPDPGAEMRAYRWQMQLYALLYRRCFGVVPDGTVLYFMGELAQHARLSGRPPRAMFEMAATERDEEQTLAWLRRALELEERCRATGHWDPPEAEQVPHRMCKGCQVRWSCPSVHVPFPFAGEGAGQEHEQEGYEP